MTGQVVCDANGRITQCHNLVAGIIEYMAEHSQYIGWTAWAAGPFWGPNSPCCTDGRQLGSLEPYSLAVDGSPGYVVFCHAQLLSHLVSLRSSLVAKV